MNELVGPHSEVTQHVILTVRDAVAPLFRQRRLALAIFLGTFAGVVLWALVMPARYEAEMKILVNRERVDPAVTPNPDTPIVASPTSSVTEEDLNSEVELLRSRDLLEQVVISCSLDSRGEGVWRHLVIQWDNVWNGPVVGRQRELARAVNALDRRLIVDPLKKTSMISVAYASPDAQLAARVLQTLATLYQKKHAEVHRPAGTFGFFDVEMERYRNELTSREDRLRNFNLQKGLVDAGIQKQLLLQQLSQSQAQLDQDQAGVDAALKRVLELKTQQSTSPERQTTVVRKADNPELLSQLNGTLLSLELKRSEMLTKYAPDYPLVREVDAQIDNAREALADARRSPVEETTTDRTPAQDWMATELAKAESDRAALEARAEADRKAVREYRAVAQEVDRDSLAQSDLIRDVKASEDNYLLYLRKREEARISDLLDQKRIVNVSIAEAAAVPAFPASHLSWLIVAGFFAASTLSMGAAYTADRIDPLFRTPEEVSRYLDLTVLAAIPAKTDYGKGGE